MIRWRALRDIHNSSFRQLTIRRMGGEQTVANGAARLEQICPHRNRTHSRSFRDFGRSESLKIDEIEDLTLPPRQCGEQLVDYSSRALPIDSTARIGGVDFALRPRRW